MQGCPCCFFDFASSAAFPGSKRQGGDKQGNLHGGWGAEVAPELLRSDLFEQHIGGDFACRYLRQ
jgi:hypothetical protein